ncbi:hypothetical protein [Xanthomonas translucens]|uniref:hypothetical protein n=1 Tax=Xanthomonas campestris pv. translucens TaxID=343 RepID=UPI000AE20EF5|nr:hypothetical protein [Xanthomonas translucens]
MDQFGRLVRDSGLGTRDSGLGTRDSGLGTRDFRKFGAFLLFCRRGFSPDALPVTRRG